MARLVRFRSLLLFRDQCFDYLINYLYTYALDFHVPLFHTAITFPLSDDLKTGLLKSNFNLYDRKNMILKFINTTFSSPTKFGSYQISHNIPQFASQILDLIVTSSAGSIDAVLYPEFSDVTSLRSTFGLIDPNNHSFYEPASLLLFDNEKLIGVNLITLDGSDSAIVWQLAVHPSYRRQKLGFKLMVESILALQKVGRTSLFLSVTVGNPASILYESLGFTYRKDTFVVVSKEY